jgi:uncharacterized integral membrane protein
MEAVMNVKLVLVSVVAVLTGIVIMQNTEVVSFRLLFWQFNMSRILLLLVTMLLGFVLGFIVAKLTQRSDDDVR